MPGPRPEKIAVVEEVREHLDGSGAAILTEYRGLKVGDLASLRRQLRSAGADYKIFKNTLVRRAMADTDRAVLDPLLEGPTAIVFVRDDVSAVAKVLREFGRAHPELIVKGGLLGAQLLDARAASALADLPSRDALLAQLAGAVAAPMQQFAGLLQALPRSLAYGLAALLEKRGGTAEAGESGEAASEAGAADTAGENGEAASESGEAGEAGAADTADTAGENGEAAGDDTAAGADTAGEAGASGDVATAGEVQAG